MKRRIHLVLCLALLTPFMLPACNTMEGLGEDIQAAGDKLDREAEENKTY